jgi:D-cysteine desulfhydrase
VNIARFPRRRYTGSPTPIQHLARLSAALNGPEIYIKRDDLLGLAAGGNKTRKLEFVVAEALAQGADTLITGASVQSNHCRLTLAAAACEGLKCRLVLEERIPNSYKPKATGNNLLFHVLGVEKIKVVPGGTDMDAAMKAMAAEVTAEGRKAYVIPVGASNPLGSLGYVAAAQEILCDSAEQRLRLDHVVCASGSGGTHAGLLVGFFGLNSGVSVTGISVNRNRGPQEKLVHALAQATLNFLGIQSKIPESAAVCLDDYVGPGYALPTAAMVEAVHLMARTEAILLDPIYTGKAMAGLIDLVHIGRLKKGENVLFVHTGGTPALYAYAETFLT